LTPTHSFSARCPIFAIVVGSHAKSDVAAKTRAVAISNVAEEERWREEFCSDAGAWLGCAVQIKVVEVRPWDDITVPGGERGRGKDSHLGSGQRHFHARA